jgi:hypothetical protein
MAAIYLYIVLESHDAGEFVQITTTSVAGCPDTEPV